jgi:ferric-dicitrate binding protein FerR (iron transport regulator)
MSETEHHLEHAEHAHHAARDPFDRRVMMTIAIIAAVLACVTLLSHRAHNETLQMQIEANDNFTLASDTWNRFQGKKNRQYLYEAFADLARMNKKELTAESDKQIASWQAKVEKYEEENKEIENEAREFEKEAKRFKLKSEHLHHVGNWHDLGELGVEFGLVLCSVAVLTRRASYWLTGMGAALVGVILAGIGVVEQYVIG